MATARHLLCGIASQQASHSYAAGSVQIEGTYREPEQSSHQLAPVLFSTLSAVRGPALHAEAGSLSEAVQQQARRRRGSEACRYFSTAQMSQAAAGCVYQAEQLRRSICPTATSWRSQDVQALCRMYCGTLNISSTMRRVHLSNQVPISAAADTALRMSCPSPDGAGAWLACRPMPGPCGCSADIGG